MGSPSLLTVNPTARGSGLSVARVTDLVGIDLTGVALGTQVWCQEKSLYFRLLIDSSAVDHSLIESANGHVGLRWTAVASQAVGVTPYVPLPGVFAVGGLAIPNLQAWFRADKGVTFTSSATWPAAASWADQGGLGNRNLTATGTPAYVPNSINGRPGLRCVPSVSWFSNTLTNLVTGDRAARTVFFVGVGRSANGGAHIQFRTGATNAYFFQHTVSGGTVSAFGNPSQSPQFLATVPPINNVPHVWRWSYDGQFTLAGTASNVRCQIDGDEQAIAGGVTPTTTETGTTGFMVGVRGDSTNFAWDGEACELIVFDRVLTAVESRAITRYIAAWYGITCTDQISVLGLGDSHIAGVGNAATLAAGGPRGYLQSQRPGWAFNCGPLYGPQSTTTGLPQTSPRAQDGLVNRHAGMTAFTSANNAAHGIGGKFLDDLLQYCGGADLMYLDIGCNDKVVDNLSAAQSATNIRAVCETSYSRLPNMQVVIVAPTKLATIDGNAGTANPVIGAIPAAIEADFATNPPKNVLRSSVDGTYAIVPQTIPDSLYVGGGDTVHITPAGWKIIIDGQILPGLAARGV
jgi:lysophospholipase L1-like esterase